METKEEKNNIFVKTTLFVVLAIILTVGVTYAYFRANIIGVESESTISVGGATLAIKYEGSNLITAENVIPGWSAKKYFNVDVTNTSGKDISYDIKLVVENSNFFTPDTFDEADSLAPSFLFFYLSECDSADDKVCSTTFLNGNSVDIQSGEQLVHTVTTKTSGKKYYALWLGFPNEDAEQSQTGTDGNPLTFSGYVTLESGGELYVRSFADDDWATIAANVRSNPSVYSVGSEKEVAIGGTNYTVRIANNSHYDSDCKDNDGNALTSQTACGFVVEFVDIVEQRALSGVNSNARGWPATAMRTYLNGEFLAKLPRDLQNVIANTTVVSGHGPTSGETNFTSTDKLYLLSTGEVWSNCLISDCHDTASFDTLTKKTTTRQLDYYSNKNVSTSSNQTYAVKKFNGTAAYWWLRAAASDTTYDFLPVNWHGDWASYGAYNTSVGLAPAFRIG